MSTDPQTDDSDAQSRLEAMRETERDTKIGYVLVAGVFAMDAAGIFAQQVPRLVFVLFFIGLLLVDAAT